jgi:2-keto-4-pentenoate hydratase/2-oxohepta-3-ene-1,7-dioic acid hydratase in catechol pathway
MSTSILRTADAWWVATVAGAATRIATDAQTTAELLADPTATANAIANAHAAARAAAGISGETVPVASLALVSPVTAPCRVVAQATNFASHVKDVGMNPQRIPLTFFRKASGSITGPYDDVIRPGHVRLLDYEVEIGLVIGRDMPVGTTITADNWTDYVAGLVVTNDISARDIQLSKTQFFESKSYPGFTPVGPALVLLERDELRRFDQLRLRLWVNGEPRQNMPVGGDMLFPPVEALRTLSGFQRLDPGDLVLTGTPVGTALSGGPAPLRSIVSLLPPALKWKLVLPLQEKNRKYLHDGDVIEATVATDDAALDLGRQRTTIRDARSTDPSGALR